MPTKTISLEEITKRVFEIRQIKKREIDIPFQRELKAYEKAHEEPHVPFFSFGEKRRKAKEEVKKYDRGLERIYKKYQNHPLIQEWEALQRQCPHNYGPWEEIDGPSEMRICKVCYHKQQRFNFDDGLLQ